MMKDFMIGASLGTPPIPPGWRADLVRPDTPSLVPRFCLNALLLDPVVFCEKELQMYQGFCERCNAKVRGLALPLGIETSARRAVRSLATQYRKMKRLDYEQGAEAAGISLPALVRFEWGSIDLPILTLARMARGYGVSGKPMRHFLETARKAQREGGSGASGDNQPLEQTE